MSRVISYLVKAAIFSLIAGVTLLAFRPSIILHLVIPLPRGLNLHAFFTLLLLFVIPPLLCIVVNIASLRNKKWPARLLSIVLILLLIVPIALTSPVFLRKYSPYVYTPTVLNAENLKVYRECIKFAKNHNEDKTLEFRNGFRVRVNGVFYMLEGNSFEKRRVREALSENEIMEMEALCEQLYEVRCIRFQRVGDMLVFYKVAHTSPPTGPGVVYSLNGQNPNEIESEILNLARPFIQVTGNWFTSRHLMLAGPRTDLPTSIPESLFDRSLKIDDVVLRELEKFD